MSPESSTAIGALRERVMALVVGFSEALPPYGEVPTALVEGDFAHGVRANAELFFDYLETGRLPDANDLADVVELALERIREGVPLQTVLERYRIGASFFWDELSATASPEELAAIRDAGPALMRYVAAVTTQVAVACVEQTGDPLWEQRDRRRAVAAALLAGNPLDVLAEPAVPKIADAFLVVVFQVDRTVDPVRAGALRSRFDRLPGGYTLLDGSGWTTLVPDADVAVTATQRVLADVLVDDPPEGLWVGAAVASSHNEIPAAAADARTVSTLCRRIGRAGILTLPDDIMLEFALATGPQAHPYLARHLRPLADQAMLAETLQAFFDCDFNQVATARRLDVHRNTVNYRFARIAALTGLDPLRPRDAMVLYAAQLGSPNVIE
ncbi:hypothetical protein FEK35_24140 [Nocardia cyriacigeorgica]|uniref:Uncharacterized protein n=1 Tax=Nocardia cyriacigeorgica TaxID=135487 RepID=A0A5R8P824_9NOCA|nr:helix-turn-helix domain-containing protein [Nocardia cyriacigeorgica]TLG00337.1 hypothetical protein FEK35_24140 [Nocardia cyriacigeorgica]